MRKISLFAVAAALIATSLGLWAAAPSNARAPSMLNPTNSCSTQRASLLKSLPTTPSYSAELVNWSFASYVSAPMEKSRRSPQVVTLSRGKADVQQATQGDRLYNLSDPNCT
jgi:hypothetical protein